MQYNTSDSHKLCLLSKSCANRTRNYNNTLLTEVNPWLCDQHGQLVRHGGTGSIWAPRRPVKHQPGSPIKVVSLDWPAGPRQPHTLPTATGPPHPWHKHSNG